jgi:hypothetical protein
VGENDLETLKLVSEMPVPRPSSRNPEVKPALDEVILRALERDPAKRYQSADEMSQDLERLVLRKRYAASSFVKQVRALVPQDEAALESEVPVEIVFGQRDSSAIAAEGMSRVAPLPPPHATVADATPAAPRTLAGALRGARASWLASLLPTTATLALMAIVLRHGEPAPRLSVTPPLPAPTTTTAPAAARVACPAPSSTVEVSIDSRPQGALVTNATTTLTASEHTRPLGETPFVLRLPRGETPVTLVMRKPGFAPAFFKLMPNHDKDVDMRLERGSGRIALAASARRRELSANIPLHSSGAPLPGIERHGFRLAKGWPAAQ